MKLDTYKFISNCSSCLSQKRHYGKVSGLLNPIPIPTLPFEFISTDVCGPFPISHPNQNLYIVNFICLFSKWAEIRAIPNQKSETIAKVLEEAILCRHDSPKY